MIAPGAASGAATGARERGAATKQRREEIAEVLILKRAILRRTGAAASRPARSPAAAPGAPRAAGELEAAAPVRGRPELLAGFPVGAELVVRGALLGVLEHLVGLLHLLEARLRVRLLAHIGVVLARQPPVGGLDLIRGSSSLHAQDLVVVTEFHVRPEPVAAREGDSICAPRRCVNARSGTIVMRGARRLACGARARSLSGGGHGTCSTTPCASLDPRRSETCGRSVRRPARAASSSPPMSCV